MTVIDGTPTRVRVDPARLEALTSAIFERLGMPADHATIHRTRAPGCGPRRPRIPRHLELPRRLLRPRTTGWVINPHPRPFVVRETPTSALWDGDGGMGFVVGDIVMRDCIERAQRMGMAFCSVANSRHFGMAQIYSRMAAAND